MVMATAWERPSRRTRVSFEAGKTQLGGQFITLKAYPRESIDIIFGEDVRGSGECPQQNVSYHGMSIQADNL